MYYIFEDEIVSVQREELADNFLCAACISLKELEQAATQFGFSEKAVSRCKDGARFRTSFDIYEDCYFARINVFSAENHRADFDRIAVFIKKNLFVVVELYDTDGSVRDLFLRSLRRFSTESVSAARLVYSFLCSVTDGDNAFLEETEFYVNDLEKAVLQSPLEEEFNASLLSLKHMLLLIRNYYEQLIDVGEALEEDENELFDESESKYFTMFYEKVNRLKDNVDMIRDSSVHLKEAYESSLELMLNRTMKVLTVFTVIFSPLNFIAAWYGMNFIAMPELRWRYGYLFVIALCLLTASVVLWWFRKKRWL